MPLERLTENCYVRIAFPIFTGVVSVLTCCQSRARRDAFENNVRRMFSLEQKEIETKPRETLLQAVARSVAAVAAAILLSMIAFHYPDTHEGVKKHVLVFSTFVALTCLAGKATGVSNSDNIGRSVLFSTLFSIFDGWVWKQT